MDSKLFSVLLSQCCFLQQHANLEFLFSAHTLICYFICFPHFYKLERNRNHPAHFPNDGTSSAKTSYYMRNHTENIKYKCKVPLKITESLSFHADYYSNRLERALSRFQAAQ